MKTIYVKRIGFARFSFSYIYSVDRNGFETLTVTRNLRSAELKKIEPGYVKVGEKHYLFTDASSVTYDLFLRDVPKSHAWVLEKLRSFSAKLPQSVFTVEMSRTEPVKLIPALPGYVKPDGRRKDPGARKNPVGRPAKPRTDGKHRYIFWLRDKERDVSRHEVSAVYYSDAVELAEAIAAKTPYKRSRLKRIT